MSPFSSTPDASIKELIRSVGPLEAYRQLIAENDALIRSPDLDHGGEITSARTAVHTTLVAEWAADQVRRFGYEAPFAVVALGGTGRGEVTPCSDLDFAFLFEGAVDGNAFLLELQRQTLHTDDFPDTHGFSFAAFPFGLDDIPGLAEKQLNSFLDMRAVFDPTGLTEKFRRKIRDSYDPFEHFLHVREFWRTQWEKAGEASERLDRFDIKHDGLRLFLGGIWTLAGKDFRHSHEIYQELEDPRDLEAYRFLLRIRCWIHLRRPCCGNPDPSGNHPEDVLRFEDFISFGDMLGPDAGERERFEFDNEVRTRLLSARRRLASFSRGVIERELHVGRRVAPGHPVVFGAGGLIHTPLGTDATPHERSRAALSLLLDSQHYGVPVAPSEAHGTFRGAGDWLVRVPELSALFQEERGSLADSFEFLCRLDGAMERLFPGYGAFEASVDGRVKAERRSMRGVLEREKMRALEDFLNAGAERMKNAVSAAGLASDEEAAKVSLVATLLDGDHLTAVKLALKTKRLPVTPADEAARDDTSRQLAERFASGLSGIPLADYFSGWEESCGFSKTTLDVTRFLIANRRAFKNRARTGINPPEEVEAFAGLCGDEQRLRALFVFTCADRVGWESERSDPIRWFNSRELYSKTLAHFRPAVSADPAKVLMDAGFGAEEASILQGFGHDLFSGTYRRHATRFGAHLLRIADEGASAGPRAAIVRDGTSIMLGVAARDWRGLAACISGALWRQGIELRQAHLFSAEHHGLALDFFHLQTDGETLPPELIGIVERAIAGQLHIAASDEATLPEIDGAFTLSEIRPGVCCLRFESERETPGAVYALCYMVFQRLRGDIHGLTAHRTRRGNLISIYLKLPPDLPLDGARAIVGA